MNDLLKSLLGITGAGLFALFAIHGTAFFQSAIAGWLFLLKLAEDAPMGLSSFALALALGVVTQATLHHWVPRFANAALRQFVIESTALVVGISVMWIQLHTLNSLLLGILAGFMAPWVQKGMCAVLGFTWHKIEGIK